MPVAMSLENTRAFKFVEVDAWDDHIFATKDFIQVVEKYKAHQYLYSYDRTDSVEEYDSFLRPAWWIARIRGDSAKDKIVLLSSFECNELLPVFRVSDEAVLYMYWSRIGQSHDNMLQKKRLYVSGMFDRRPIKLSDEVQINAITGAQYFSSDEEQDAYCKFLGLIPRQKRTDHMNLLFERGIIEPNGFVPMENRQYSKDISECVGQSKFKNNPVQMAIKIVEARHEELRTESHVASILLKDAMAKIKVEKAHRQF